MKAFYSLIFVFIICGCSDKPDEDLDPALALCPAVSLILAEDSASVDSDFSEVPLLKFTFKDTIGLKGDSLSRRIFRKYRLNAIERFYDGSEYSILGKIEKGKVLYILYSRNSGSECVHFLVSINKISGLMISNYQTAYEDWVEYYSNSHSFIGPEAMGIVEENFRYGDNFQSSDLVSKNIELLASGHFKTRSVDTVRYFYPPVNKTKN
ncbi:MAG: hypothetical protein IAF38_16525 [Bacteroidia bacterium]|nr:hypothetical protein [Bacteroidia bacterium]